MMSINSRFKMAVLAVSMLAANQASAAFSLSTFVPNTKEKLALGVFLAMYVRLCSKPKQDPAYKGSDWREDLRSTMEDYGIFSVELYKQLVYIFDKYVIGRKLSIVDRIDKISTEDGNTSSYKRKACDSKPFGAMGLLDAYVIGMLDKIGKIYTDLDKASKVFELIDRSAA